jgi:hypothetical protein
MWALTANPKRLEVAVIHQSQRHNTYHPPSVQGRPPDLIHGIRRNPSPIVMVLCSLGLSRENVTWKIPPATYQARAGAIEQTIPVKWRHLTKSAMIP